MACPYCTKEVQTRAMFNHIRKLHPSDMLSNTTTKWLDEAQASKPLKFYWTTKNDFDEEEMSLIYACLATNKTFTTEERALQHFKQNKDSLKEHNKQLKELKKDYVTYKKQEAKKEKEKWKLLEKTDPFRLRLNAAISTNDIELIKSLWIGIFHHVKIIKYCQWLTEKQGYRDETPMYIYIPKNQYTEITYKQFIEKQVQLLQKINKLYEERCSDFKTLQSLWHKACRLWSVYYKDSYMNLFEDLKEIYPNFNYLGEDKFFNYATEEMEPVDF